MAASSPDLPPLFPLGFHHLHISDVERVCVDCFPLSTSRGPIMDGLKTFIQRLNDAAIACEIWLDGSFVTEKIDPKDVDVVVRCDGEIYNSGTPEQRAAIDWVIDNQKATLKCDSYALLEYPPGHPLYEEGQWWFSYWHVKWGFSREEDPKGILVVSPGGDVNE